MTAPVESLIPAAHKILAQHNLHASASKVVKTVRRFVRERDAGETVEFASYIVSGVLGERACKVRGCPGRMRGNVPCPVCRHYPKGFHSAQRLFWDGGETVRADRGRRAPTTTGVDEAEVERLEAAMAREIAQTRIAGRL